MTDFFFKICNIALLLIITTASFTACKSSDDKEDETENAYVNTPAWPVFDDEQNLAIFYFTTFNYDPSQQPENDEFVVYFENFQPQSNEEPDDDDVDQTTNDLIFEEVAWEDKGTKWVINNILSSPQAELQKARSYRVLNDGVLEDEIFTKNLPIYEAIDEDIFTEHLGTTYIWDFGDFDDAEDEDLSGEEIKDFEESENGYPLLPNASIWSDVNNEDRTFSSGAMLYSASYSINKDVFLVEAVDDGGDFSLIATNFHTGSATLADALANFQEPTRLPYKFTTGFIDNHTIYIGFDSATQTATLATAETGGDTVTVTYTINDSELYAEVDIQELDKENLDKLGLETSFNPIIIGPTGNNSDYYFGKHYIPTTKEARENLPPIFFFNGIAQSDIQNAFKDWRDEKYNDFL